MCSKGEEGGDQQPDLLLVYIHSHVLRYPITPSISSLTTLVSLSTSLEVSSSCSHLAQVPQRDLPLSAHKLKAAYLVSLAISPLSSIYYSENSIVIKEKVLTEAEERVCYADRTTKLRAHIKLVLQKPTQQVQEHYYLIVHSVLTPHDIPLCKLIPAEEALLALHTHI